MSDVLVVPKESKVLEKSEVLEMSEVAEVPMVPEVPEVPKMFKVFKVPEVSKVSEVSEVLVIPDAVAQAGSGVGVGRWVRGWAGVGSAIGAGAVVPKVSMVPVLPVKLDVFHAVQRITLTCPR